MFSGHHLFLHPFEQWHKHWIDENVLIVVQGDHPLRYSNALEATDCSWIGEPPDVLRDGQPLGCNAKIRYRQDDQACTVVQNEAERLVVTFDAAQTAVAPGQFVVFYRGERCLGGAVIDRAISNISTVKDNTILYNINEDQEFLKAAESPESYGE